MNIIFFEENRKAFLPLVFTKPLAKLRFGILTIEQKWQKNLSAFNVMVSPPIKISYLTEKYLSVKYPLLEEKENIFINSRFFPNQKIIDY